MKVFDLTRLRGVTTPQTFTEDAYYGQFGNSHNIAINEATGFAYAVGSNTCSGGPHMVDISSPKAPSYAGCVSQDGYTHDTQCVVYHGPDADYTGRELCVNSNEDTVTIVDVTAKSSPRQIVRKTYSGAQYTHQGWLTDDHRYFLLDDELDETYLGGGTKTRVFDLANVDAPVHIGTYTSSASATDHNQYVKGSYTYQANYRAGLRILNLANIASGSLTEAGYFDIYPSSNSNSMNGAWSNYPYFASGTVVVSGIEQGLYVLKPNLTGTPPPTGPRFENGTDVTINDNTTVESPITVTGVSGNGVDLAVPGRYAPQPLPPEESTTALDRYTLTLDGGLQPGRASQLLVWLGRDGLPVDDLEPHLGAYGHLVALRQGDLAYLHVHPALASTPSSVVAFTVQVPSAGTYRLFFEFRHEGVVRTAAFTVTAG